MNNEHKKDMINAEAEKKFKDTVFNTFASQIPGVHMDQHGIIVVPMRVRRRKTQKDQNHE